MNTALTQPVATGNPGIVPPWLQGTPPQAAPSSSPAVAVPTATTGVHHAPQFGGGEDFGFGGGSGRLGGADARRGADVLLEQRRLEAVVADVQAKYAKLGIRPDEGNGPVKATYEPEYPNASYNPFDGHRDAGTGIWFDADSISVGIDERSGQSFVDAEDVIAHELGHRLVQHMVRRPLSYDVRSEDPGINESLADTFSAMIDSRDPWTIGDTLVGGAIRSMDHPERVGDAGTVDELLAGIRSGAHDFPIGQDRFGRVVTATDSHYVAGVPNKAASIIGKALGIEKMGRIYIDAVRNYVEPNKEIEGLAAATMRAATDLFGAASPELQATRDAWDAVGVLDYVERAYPDLAA